MNAPYFTCHATQTSKHGLLAEFLHENMQKQAFHRCFRPDSGTSLGAPFTMAAPHGAREARAPERGRTERCDALVAFLGGDPPPEGEALPPERRDEARKVRIPLVHSLALVLRCVCLRVFVENPCQPNGVMHMTPFLVALSCASCATSNSHEKQGMFSP